MSLKKGVGSGSLKSEVRIRGSRSGSAPKCQVSQHWFYFYYVFAWMHHTVVTPLKGWLVVKFQIGITVITFTPFLNEITAHFHHGIIRYDIGIDVLELLFTYAFILILLLTYFASWLFELSPQDLNQDPHSINLPRSGFGFTFRVHGIPYGTMR